MLKNILQTFAHLNSIPLCRARLHDYMHSLDCARKLSDDC